MREKGDRDRQAMQDRRAVDLTITRSWLLRSARAACRYCEFAGSVVPVIA
jgi:hypothetical protein